MKWIKFIKSKCWIQRNNCCHVGGEEGREYIAVEGRQEKFMWEKNVCSADRLQTKHIICWYALLFIASISCSQRVIRWHLHHAETLENTLSHYLWGKGYGAKTKANLALLQTAKQFTHGKGCFLKVTNMLDSKLELRFVCFDLYPLGPQRTRWQDFNT